MTPFVPYFWAKQISKWLTKHSAAKKNKKYRRRTSKSKDSIHKYLKKVEYKNYNLFATHDIIHVITGAVRKEVKVNDAIKAFSCPTCEN